MIRVVDICGSVLNTRFFGKKLRREMLAVFNREGKIALDFSGVSSISQSFGDESFGKFAEKIGLEDFKKKVKIINLKKQSGTVIKYVVLERTKKPKEEKEMALV